MLIVLAVARFKYMHIALELTHPLVTSASVLCP